jgi:hypothetical protein
MTTVAAAKQLSNLRWRQGIKARPHVSLSGAGDFQRMMLDRLNTNASKSDPNVTSTNTKKTGHSVGISLSWQGGLMPQWRSLSGGIRDHHQGHMLSKAIALFVAVKMSKSKICGLKVDIWAVLLVVVKNASISLSETNNLQQYLLLVQRIEIEATAR